MMGRTSSHKKRQLKTQTCETWLSEVLESFIRIAIVLLAEPLKRRNTFRPIYMLHLLYSHVPLWTEAG